MVQYYSVSFRLTGHSTSVVEELPNDAKPLTDKNRAKYSPQEGFCSGSNDYRPISEDEARRIMADMGRGSVADKIRKEMRERDSHTQQR